MMELMKVERERKIPWIGVGVSGAWDDYNDALEAAGMDFYVIKDAAYWMRPDGGDVYTPERINNTNVTYRTDTNQQLGVVADQYQVVQNAEAFKLIQPFVDGGGVITAAGYTEQGLNFMVAHMENQNFLGDDFDFSIICTNSFNGRFPLSLIITPIRCICNNMFRKLHKDQVMMLRHCTNINDRLLPAAAAVTTIQEWINGFGEQLDKVAMKKKSDKDIRHLIEMLFPYGQEGGAREATSRQRVDAARELFYDAYYLAPDNANFQGTALGFLNAYYDYLSHGQFGRVVAGNYDHRRLSALVSGQAVDGKLMQEARK